MVGQLQAAGGMCSWSPRVAGRLKKKKTLEEIMTAKFPNMMQTVNPQTHKSNY